jgi:hypothetical protein
LGQRLLLAFSWVTQGFDFCFGWHVSPSQGVLIVIRNLKRDLPPSDWPQAFLRAPIKGCRRRVARFWHSSRLVLFFQGWSWFADRLLIGLPEGLA